MATGGSDGSLNFDTKINTEGFDAGMSTLTKAVEKLSGLIENLTNRMEGSFSGAGSAAQTAAQKVDTVAESARKAAAELERLQKEKDATFRGTIENNVSSSVPEREGNYDVYGNDVDEIIRKQRELEAAARETTSTVTEGTDQQERSVVGLKDSMRLALEVFQRFPSTIKGAFEAAGDAASGATMKTRSLQDEIDRYTDALYYAERSGLGLGDKAYDEAYVGLSKAKKKAEEYKKSLLGVDQNQKKADKSSKKLGTSMKQTAKKGAVPLSKSIVKLSNMFQLMVIRMAMRAALQAAKEGFENLAQYSDETNKSISSLMSANTRLKNSFATAAAPVLNVMAPALKSLIDLLSEATSWAGQLFATLSGKTTFVKAVDVEEDYGASLKDSNKELEKKEKLNKKLTFSFDDLIQAQSNAQKSDYIGPTPDQMFETVEITDDIVTFADTVKGVLSGLFDPIKQSWEENGHYATEAAKTAFNSLKTLAGDVGASFMQVWKTEGYGKQITDDLLITFGNLMLTVGNLADRFDEAWRSGDTGTSIMRHLGDIVLEITGVFREASESIKDWSSKLDFSPLLRSFDNVLARITPIVNKVGSILLWLLNSVFLPLSKWALEKAVPVVLDLMAAGLEVLNSVLDALQPLANWLWEKFLKPLGEWTGEIIIAALEKIVEWLTKFSDWISSHQEEVQLITEYVLAFFAAWKVTEFVENVKRMIDILSEKGLMGILSQLSSKLDIASWGFLGTAAAIAAVVSAAFEIYQNWDKMTPTEKFITGLLAAAAAAATLAVAIGGIEGPLGVTLRVAAITAGVAAALIAINAGKRSSAYQGSHSGGGGSFSAYSIPIMASYKMPRLATGTVVPPRAGEFAAILGDNNVDTEIVSPIPAMKQAFKEAIAEMGGIGGNQTLRADLIVDGTKFGQLVYKFNNKERQRVGVRMVTEG
ncbi:hypothetical protein [Enterocloster asparagiformis]|uniref:hypothetical protein n=1 Tax=Enterocloster asparagiformis TaxID=333367 RepID=UPI001FA89D57|nr:hypothetical protein [Enterocloster asparagiformis]DAP75667.1 MAG TPA: minor tail protein [Caudoviricetes sp.]